MTVIDHAALQELAHGHGAPSDASVEELMPSGTIRSFRVGSVAIRVDVDETGRGLGAEAQALRALSTATAAPIAPKLLASEILRVCGRARPVLIYGWVDGEILSLDDARRRAADVGQLFAQLHGAQVFDLVTRFAPQGPRTLLQEFKRASDDLKQWTLAREADGLGPDLLTLTLSDLQRNLREFVLAQDQHFLVRSRRTLCHGFSSPRTVINDASGRLTLCHFDRAHIGDPARDLARFALVADLDEHEEDAMLRAYLSALHDLGREDPGFISRYFARRVVALFVAPTAQLKRVIDLKHDEFVVVEDRVAAIEAEIGQAQRDLVRALNGLKNLTQNTRPIALREVAAMGKVAAYEELLLEGRGHSIALHGDAYSGKTEVGSAIARRLQYAYINTGVVGRALALVERRRIAAGESVAPRALVHALFAEGFHLDASPEAPFYVAHLAGADMTDDLADSVDRVRGALLLDDDTIRNCLRDEIASTHAGRGIVCEGAYAHTLLPGRVRDFHLRCDPQVRRARLMHHRPEIEDDDEADALLAQLDRVGLEVVPTAVVIDLEGRPASAGALEVIRSLVPTVNRRTSDDLSGRPPLFLD